MDLMNTDTALALKDSAHQYNDSLDPLASLAATRLLDLNSPTPLYAQLASVLADYISTLGA